MEKIGFIGLGKMGFGMASNLIKKGFDVTGFDMNADVVQKLAAPSNTVLEECSFIITMLPASKQVDEVLLNETGLMSRLKKGTLVMDMSTISPETTDKLHDTGDKYGLMTVDAPVGRLAYHADRGESLFMCGGTDAAFLRAKPALDAMGTTVHHCGKGGAGTRTKLVNNYLAIILCQLNAEALALSQRFGLDLASTLEVLHGTTATNGQLKINWANKVLKGDVEPGFSIDLAHKDLSLILDAANNARVPVPVAAAAREAFSQARAKGYGGHDFSAMVDVLCDTAQIERARL